MAKEEKMHGKLPLSYGEENEYKKMPSGGESGSQSKERAAMAPKIKEGTKGEGRAGRVRHGSETIGVKKEHFNEKRKEADCM